MSPPLLDEGVTVGLVVPPPAQTSVIRDYAGGLGFEADSGYTLPPLDLMQLAAAAADRHPSVLVDAQGARLRDSEVLTLVDGCEMCVVEVSLPTLDDDLAFATRLGDHGQKVLIRCQSDDGEVLREILSTRAVTGCLVGECEPHLVDILAGRSRRGLALLTDRQVQLEPAGYVADLDALPWPRRDLATCDYHYPKLGSCATMQTSRGCPYPCRYYCPYPLIQGRRWRARSAESVVAELQVMVAAGHRNVLFRDPVFSFDTDRVRQICGLIESCGLRFHWWCETRADCLDDDLIRVMARAGCKGINVGVESGDPNLRHARLKRGVDDATLLRVATSAGRHGVDLAMLLMVGFPGEDRRGILATASLLRTCRPQSIGIAFPVNHPGTELDQDARSNDWLIPGTAAQSDGSVPVLAGPYLNADDMLEGRRLLTDLFESISAGDSASEEQRFDEVASWASGG